MDVSRSSRVSPPASVASSFKGLALFTPGGDCVYCLDQHKQAHWHWDLCAALQRALDLREPPYFLLPCFTATVDRWFDRQRQTWVTLAEAYPRVLRYQTLLNVLFSLDNLPWQPNYTQIEACSQTVIESYRPAFPQLWESHDLILRVEAVSRSMLPGSHRAFCYQHPLLPCPARLGPTGILLLQTLCQRSRYNGHGANATEVTPDPGVCPAHPL
ncbi:MAG TPA: hypothetical protein IGR64_17815 [Leptolyngbyaceae cyanobacterium M65_K2018_010]|nr:hypothetical protein [Leptolyngbyaceae cyanobacterium M65_K2018_010]